MCSCFIPPYLWGSSLFSEETLTRAGPFLSWQEDVLMSRCICAELAALIESKD